jgi:hypothetical protein
MTEDDARALLQAWDGDGLEAWIADQPWRATSNGWEVVPDWDGWRFQVEQAPPRLRLRSSPPGSAAPAEWLVWWG